MNRLLAAALLCCAPAAHAGGLVARIRAAMAAPAGPAAPRMFLAPETRSGVLLEHAPASYSFHVKDRAGVPLVYRVQRASGLVSESFSRLIGGREELVETRVNDGQFMTVTRHGAEATPETLISTLDGRPHVEEGGYERVPHWSQNYERETRRTGTTVVRAADGEALHATEHGIHMLGARIGTPTVLRWRAATVHFEGKPLLAERETIHTVMGFGTRSHAWLDASDRPIEPR